MQIQHIPLNRFLPNPDQPRGGEDPQHIKNLAMSIASDGLLQLPVGRWVFPEGRPVLGMGTADLTDNGMHVQLAFGHSRLAAYKWLEDVKGHSDLVGDWSRMPVIVREIPDEELFRLGISENLARKDLNPLEVARAMQRYREKFGKTSQEIGALFGLSDSAVRNKMRLLGLPEGLQNALRAGDITEGVARALLPLYDIPEALRLRSEDTDDLKPSEVIEAAFSGISPDRVSELVTRLTRLLIPPVEQIAIPAAAEPAPSVSVETLEDDDESADNEESPESDAGLEDEDEKQMDLPATPLERVFAPVTHQPAPVPAPKPAPIPAPAPARPAQPAPVQAKPAPAPAPKPEPKPAPAPAPGPAPAVTWEGSTILLSLTLWPEDAHGNRMVSIGGRVGQGSPRMALASLADVELPRQLLEMMEQLKGGLA